MAKKIWYARYENEHPERTEKSIKEAKAKTEEQINELNANKQDLIEQFNKEELLHNYKLMWTGAGIGMGGLALLGAGIGLYVNNQSPTDLKFYALEKGAKKYTSTPNPKFIASCVLISTGAALTVTGSVLTGVFGSKYTHLKSSEMLSIAVTPNNIVLGIQF